MLFPSCKNILRGFRLIQGERWWWWGSRWVHRSLDCLLPYRQTIFSRAWNWILFFRRLHLAQHWKTFRRIKCCKIECILSVLLSTNFVVLVVRCQRMCVTSRWVILFFRRWVSVRSEWCWSYFVEVYLFALWFFLGAWGVTNFFFSVNAVVH